MPVVSSMIASTAIAAATITVPVTSVNPVVENRPMMIQEQQCTNIVNSYDNGDRALLGGIIGGVIGSNIGKDHNTRRIMTGVGAILGARAGSQHNTNPTVTYNTHCAPTLVQRPVPTVVAYNVSYILDGVTQTSVMSYDPGPTLTLQRTYQVR